MNLEEIKARIRQNIAAGLEEFNGLTSAEIGRYNRAVMFGDNDEAFPDQDTWSTITD